MKWIKALVSLCLFLLLLSCSGKPKGWWQEARIAVMADSTDWAALQGVLRHTYERVVRTPQPEKTYSLSHVSRNEFERFSTFRYLMLAATLDSDGKIGQIAQNLLDQPDVRTGVEDGRYFVFIQRNQWAKDQIFVILIGKDIPALRTRIENNGHMLYAIFDSDFKKRIEKEMFERGEKKKLEKMLLDLYGWTLRIQHDYHLMDEAAQEGYIWLRRLYPERWLFVRWVEEGDTSILHPDWVIRERNRLEKTYMEGEQVSEHYRVSFRSEFLGRDALVTTGLWEHEEKEVGGPFKNYTFYDPLSGRLYMIDLAMFAPEYTDRKLPFLKRMDIMAHTFHTIYDTVENE